MKRLAALLAAWLHARRRGLLAAAAAVAVAAVAELLAYRRFLRLNDAMGKRSYPASVVSSPAYRKWIASLIAKSPDPDFLLRGAFFFSCQVHELTLKAVREWATHLLFLRADADLLPSQQLEVDAVVTGISRRLGVNFSDEGVALDSRRIQSFVSLRDLSANAGVTLEVSDAGMKLRKRHSMSAHPVYLQMQRGFLHAPVDESAADVSPDQNRFGDPPLSACYKPLAVVAGIKLLRGASQLHLRFSVGFRQVCCRAGVTFWHRRQGSGSGGSQPPALFVHGFGLGLAPYGGFLRRLAEDRDVVAIELPNISHGRFVREYPSPSALADTVREVLAELGYERVVIVAHSYGTAATQYILKRHPDLCLRLVLLDPICFFTGFVFTGVYPFKRLGDVLAELDDGAGRVEKGLAVFLWWFVNRDLHVQWTSKRELWGPQFWIADEQLAGDVMVFLADGDDVVASSKLRTFITEHHQNVELIYWDGIGHGGFLADEAALGAIFEYIRSPLVGCSATGS